MNVKQYLLIGVSVGGLGSVGSFNTCATSEPDAPATPVSWEIFAENMAAGGYGIIPRGSQRSMVFVKPASCDLGGNIAECWLFASFDLETRKTHSWQIPASGAPERNRPSRLMVRPQDASWVWSCAQIAASPPEFVIQQAHEAVSWLVAPNSPVVVRELRCVRPQAALLGVVSTDPCILGVAYSGCGAATFVTLNETALGLIPVAELANSTLPREFEAMGYTKVWALAETDALIGVAAPFDRSGDIVVALIDRGMSVSSFTVPRRHSDFATMLYRGCCRIARSDCGQRYLQFLDARDFEGVRTVIVGPIGERDLHVEEYWRCVRFDSDADRWTDFSEVDGALRIVSECSWGRPEVDLVYPLHDGSAGW